jgi:hypothetical protein
MNFVWCPTTHRRRVGEIERRLFPGSLDAIEHVAAFRSGGHRLRRRGSQPRKVKCSGLFEAVEKRVLIYIHKEQELDDVERRQPAEH